MEMKPYIVYVKPDAQNRITAVNSSAFLTCTDSWVEIDSGYGDKYHHAQGNYFSKPIYDERGICLYKLVDGKPVERTADEKDADHTEPVQHINIEARVENVESKTAALEESLDMLLSGVTSDV